MAIAELEVYLTPDGLGRAAIVRRSDGLLCIYLHWKWSPETLEAAQLDVAPERKSWFTDPTPLPELYRVVEPVPGLYGTLEDARREVRSLRGFAQATLKPST